MRLRPEAVVFFGLSIFWGGVLFDLLAERESNRGRAEWVAIVTVMLLLVSVGVAITCLIDLISGRGFVAP